MSTLKVNKLRDTAGSADAITLDPNGGVVLAGVTTVSTINVGSGVTISSDGDVFHTGVCTATTFSGSFTGSGANITGISTAATSDYVKIATASWTSDVASVAIDNLDTTTYKYFIMLWNHVPETDNTNLRFKWRLDGSDTTAASYDWAAGTTYGHSTTGTVQNEEYAKVCFAMGNNAWEGCQLEFVIYPKSSAESGYQGNSVIMNGFYNTNATSPRSVTSASFYDGGTTYYPNGFKLYQSAGNLNTGDYAIYGVKR